MTGPCPDQQERRLIERAQQGSLDAFEQLVIRYRDRLYRFLLARSGNSADAEDALQEAFMAAHRYLHGYRSDWAFSTWLYRIAIRELGRVSRRLPEPPLEMPPEADLPAQERLADERRKRVWSAARNCLNDQQFSALWMVYADGLPLADAARVLGRPQPWIKVNLYRARQRLARELSLDELLDEQPVSGLQVARSGWGGGEPE